MRRDAQENFNRILDAARSLMHTDEHHFTMEDVACRADVGIGTIYRKFPTKKCLIEALLLEQITQTLHQFDAAYAHEDPWQGYCDMLLCAGELFNEFSKLVSLSNGQHEQYYVNRTVVHNKIGAVLTRGQEAGVVRDDLTIADICCMFVMLSCPVISHQSLADTGKGRMIEVMLAGSKPAIDPFIHDSADPAEFSKAFQAAIT